MLACTSTTTLRVKHSGIEGLLGTLQAFNASRETASLAAGSFKAGASELLCVYPLLRHFAEQIVKPTGKIPQELASFLACCNLVDVMSQAKYRGADVALAQRFDDLAAKFRRLHGLAYQHVHIRPKHHFLQHVATQWHEDGFVLDCFVHERKHQCIKAEANPIKNTTAFERSVLAATLNCMIHQLEEVGNRLTGGAKHKNRWHI